MHFEYYMPTRLIFGRGRLKELSHYPFPGSKALILIHRGNPCATSVTSALF